MSCMAWILSTGQKKGASISIFYGYVKHLSMYTLRTRQEQSLILLHGAALERMGLMTLLMGDWEWNGLDDNASK